MVLLLPQISELAPNPNIYTTSPAYGIERQIRETAARRLNL
jgi:hypothetical protein